MKISKYILCLLISMVSVMSVAAESPNRLKWRQVAKITDRDFFKTPEAERIARQVLAYQRVTGGWPKNIDMARPMSDDEIAEVVSEKQRRDDSTTDNKATTMEMRYMAQMYEATGDTAYRDAFRRGVEFLLSGQYPNGGWPQFWPDMRDYQEHITYNDDAMVNTMLVLRDVMSGESPFGGDLVEGNLRSRLDDSFKRGVECILATQIMVDGEPTVWCQQHYKDTYLPAPARSYELPSFCSSESVSIVRLLMGLPDPDERVIRAVDGAMKWFDKAKIVGLRLEHRGEYGSPDADLYEVEDPDAKPIWSRFYDLDKCEPYVCDRDGVPHRHISEIGHERRNGYSWFTYSPSELYPLYEEWKNKLCK